MPRPSTQRRDFALLLAAFSCAAVFSLTSCSRSIQSEQPSQETPQIELEENELTHYNEDGKAAWVLHAHSVEYFEESQETQANEVEVHFLDQDGGEALIVQADSLTFYHRSGDLQFSGNLHAHDPEGLQFSTDEAYWEEKTHTLRSDSPVHVEREDLTLTGQGFEYRADEGTLTIKDAHLQFNLKEPSP
ncbi:MAG: LPS export ABC transporter periplasmic protein LptC [Candidatus Fraserbacteria bacterium RBG_16_55_9]|uniref:LPS export ABC transporter periplasmic protein LptC n=1 Tax=Fraserbacteria sp. (strain RBG_16_55_9) TaxID=1817864 RepID=A0A1F5V259_FRAXR|nr:MAG: LPS export ABC transporter periplasmic protein LptC [Candidatus Fraserbacteria bacterium RBG_16_55_9]